MLVGRQGVGAGIRGVGVIWDRVGGRVFVKTEDPKKTHKKGRHSSKLEMSLPVTF